MACQRIAIAANIAQAMKTNVSSRYSLLKILRRAKNLRPVNIVPTAKLAQTAPLEALVHTQGKLVGHDTHYEGFLTDSLIPGLVCFNQSVEIHDVGGEALRQ